MITELFLPPPESTVTMYSPGELPYWIQTECHEDRGKSSRLRVRPGTGGAPFMQCCWEPWFPDGMGNHDAGLSSFRGL